MRAGIGLVALLIGVALMVYLFAQVEIPKVRAGKKAQEQVRQISGYGQDEIPAMESFAATASFRGQKLSLQITGVTPGGAMDSYFGLLPGDEVTEVNGVPIEAVSNNDEELAKAMVAEAYSKKQPLTVRRGGQTITLPLPAGAAAPPAPAAPAPNPSAGASEAAAPSPAPAPRRPSGVERQLQGIQDAAGGGQGFDE